MAVIKEVYDKAIVPALGLLPAKMRSNKALVMMIAIGLQESRLIHRKQIGGPAKGLFQFERGGGVRGVLNHQATKQISRELCVGLMGTDNLQAVYDELEHSDVLAAIFCRLLLWTDPRSLPSICDVDGAWNLYIRTWRPGKPHRHTWDILHQQARIFVESLP